MEAAVVEEKAAEIRQDLRALLDSATQELTRLGQELHDLREEKLKLMEKELKLIDERRYLESLI